VLGRWGRWGAERRGAARRGEERRGEAPGLISNIRLGWK
jgi:hypothetical protein